MPTRKMKTCLILIIFSLPLLLPLTTPGMLVSEDGLAHLVRQEGFTRIIARGDLLPRWAPELNFGFGSPLFLYNWLFPYYVGTVLQLFSGIDALAAIKWTLTLGLLLTAMTTFLWLSRFGRLAAITGAFLSIWVPYRVVTLYERGTSGEAWLAVFPPLILWLAARKDWVGQTLLPLAWAGLFLSHSVGALMMTPVILMLALLERRHGGKATAFFLSFITGLLLSAFSWVPAAFESQKTTNVADMFIDTAVTLHADYAKSSVGSVLRDPITALTSGPRALSFGFSIPFIFFLTVFRIILNEKRRAQTASFRSQQFVTIALILLSLFLMSPWSTWFWLHVPLATTILYPWRLVQVVVLGGAWLAAWIVAGSGRYRLRFAVLIAALSVLSTIPALTTSPRFISLPPDWLETTKPDVIGEYLPRGMTYDRLEARATTIAPAERGQVARGDGWVGLNQLAFPGWNATAEDVDLVVDPDYPGREGLVTVRVPPSTPVEFSFRETPIRQLGFILSLAGFLLWLWIIARGRQTHAMLHPTKTLTPG